MRDQLCLRVRVLLCRVFRSGGRENRESWFYSGEEPDTAWKLWPTGPRLGI